MPITDIDTNLRIIQECSVFVLYSSLTKDQSSWLFPLLKDSVLLCCCLTFFLQSAPLFFCPLGYSYSPPNRMDARVVIVQNSRHHVMLNLRSLFSTLFWMGAFTMHYPVSKVQTTLMLTSGNLMWREVQGSQNINIMYSHTLWTLFVLGLFYMMWKMKILSTSNIDITIKSPKTSRLLVINIESLLLWG